MDRPQNPARHLRLQALLIPRQIPHCRLERIQSLITLSRAEWLMECGLSLGSNRYLIHFTMTAYYYCLGIISDTPIRHRHKPTALARNVLSRSGVSDYQLHCYYRCCWSSRIVFEVSGSFHVQTYRYSRSRWRLHSPHRFPSRTLHLFPVSHATCTKLRYRLTSLQPDLHPSPRCRNRYSLSSSSLSITWSELLAPYLAIQASDFLNFLGCQLASSLSLPTFDALVDDCREVAGFPDCDWVYLGWRIVQILLVLLACMPEK
jgi:hypothetical protein